MSYRVSAVLNSYRHPIYLWDALASALTQDSRERFEILLLTPFPDLEFPLSITHLAGKCDREVVKITIPDRPIGHAWSIAAAAATGQFLAFLDDDDLWEPGKIRSVQDALDQDPNLGFFHNSQTLVDSRNHPLHSWGPHRMIRQPSSLTPAGRSVMVNPGDPDSFKVGRGYAPDVNNSSVAISASILRGVGNTLSGLHRGEDTFLYYCALASRQHLYLTSDRLTRYRIHRSSNTSAPPVRGGVDDPGLRYRDLVTGQQQCLRILRESVAKDLPDNVEESLRTDEAFWDTLAGLAGIRSPRAIQRGNIAQLLGGKWLRPRARDLYAAILGVGEFLAPGPAEMAFRSWRRLWF